MKLRYFERTHTVCVAARPARTVAARRPAHGPVRGRVVICAVICACLMAVALSACGGFKLDGSWKITEGPAPAYEGAGWMWPKGQVIVFKGGETNLMPQLMAPTATYVLEERGTSGSYTLTVSSGWNAREFSLRVINNNEIEIGNVPNYDGRVLLKRS